MILKHTSVCCSTEQNKRWQSFLRCCTEAVEQLNPPEEIKHADTASSFKALKNTLFRMALCQWLFSVTSYICEFLCFAIYLFVLTVILYLWSSLQLGFDNCYIKLLLFVLLLLWFCEFLDDGLWFCSVRLSEREDSGRQNISRYVTLEYGQHVTHTVTSAWPLCY